MTVRDLVEHAPELEGMEIVVRENGGGRWIQGFRISKHAKLYPADMTIEHREQHPWIDESERLIHGVTVPSGEIVDVDRGWAGNKLLTRVMSIEPKKAPKEILDLEVKWYLPRNIPTIHGEKLFHNEFSLEISCFPPEKQEKLAEYREIKEKEIDDQLEGQMSIEDWLGGENE